jgi:hypothetical protein
LHLGFLRLFRLGFTGQRPGRRPPGGRLGRRPRTPASPAFAAVTSLVAGAGPRLFLCALAANLGLCSAQRVPLPR